HAYLRKSSPRPAPSMPRGTWTWGALRKTCADSPGRAEPCGCPLRPETSKAAASPIDRSPQQSVVSHRSMAPGRVPKIGSLFAKRYVVESVLGQGAVGLVFGVRDEKTGVACALKLLNRPEARVDAARVIREARALMLISNPHVVRVFDVAER